ncbi:MAG TPA: translocation/assembly module TamB domain-containing protein [Gemmatimonadaceae bacterium]
MRRVAKVVGVVLLVIIAVIGVGVWVLTSTSFGHEKVRQFALKTMASKVHGKVTIGSIGGNLLRGTVIKDFAITDSTGAPFIVADEVTARYSLAALAKKKIVVTSLTLVRPVVVLDRQPGGKWNFNRIFPPDTTTKTDTTHGFGSWITLRDVTLEQGKMVVRSPWHPDSTLTTAQQDSVIAQTLGGNSRNMVERVAGGYQKVMSFDRINGKLPELLLADPGAPAKSIEVATLQMVAAPFRPPVAEVRDLKGKFEFTSDSLWWTKADAKLPGSHITGDGKYVYATSGMDLRLHGAPVATGDLRWLYPRLPAGGGGSLDFAMLWEGNTQTYDVRNADIGLQGATAKGSFGLTLGDSMSLHDTNLRLASLDTRLIEQLVPGFTSPRRGTLGGRVALGGGKHAMRVNADLAFDDVSAGTSRVAAVGEVGMVETGGVRARSLQLRFDPVQVALARTWMPTLPVGGIVSGTATVDGTTATELVAVADLTHSEDGAHSRLTGRGAFRTNGGLWMDVDARARPLSLAEVGRFVPSIGLRGVAAGPIRLTGPMQNLRVASSLRFQEGGELDVRGTLDLKSQEKGYDVATAVRLFNANVVIAKAPQTSLTAKATARGRGFTPATMTMRATADVAASQYDSLAIDSASVRVGIANGMLTAEKIVLAGSRAVITGSGSFGLVAGREGTLTFRGQADSLQRFARYFPHDTTVVAPRPGRVAAAMKQARADSLELAKRTEVERAVTGAPAPKLKANVPPSVRSDSVSGRVVLAATIRGALPRFDARGRLAGENLAGFGSTAHAARVDFAWTNARTPQSTLAVGAQLDAASLKGFALDSVDARVSYANSRGQLDFGVWQDHVREYSIAGDYVIDVNGKELRLARTQLRFDTTTWRGTQTATIRWGQRGLQVHSLELRNASNGRIFADGTIPTSGNADLRFAIDNFALQDIAGLLQTDLELAGITSVSGQVQGTLADPRFRVALGLTQASYGGTRLPELHGTLDYARRSLDGHIVAARLGGQPMAVADGRLPIDLALQRSDTGSRLRRGPVTLDLVADSLPLELIPKFTDAVADVRGRAAGRIAVRGTMRSPKLSGVLALDQGNVRIVMTGMRLQNVAGYVRLQNDTVYVDSLAARAGGPVRLNGTIAVTSFSNPSFDLHLFAQNARVLDNEQGLLRGDAELAMAGPFSSAYISGRARVRNGVIYLPESSNKSVISSGDPALFNVVDTSVVSDREMLPTQSPLLAGLRMDVQLNVSRNTWVRSKEANVEIYTPDEGLTVHVDRSKQTLALDGVVNTDNGQYTFLTKRFIIRRGSALFIGSNTSAQEPMNPTLQVTGEYEVRLPQREALSIQVIIGGTLLRPKLTLQSDAQPPISQSDLLSYLAFGRSSSSLLQMEGSSNSSGNANGNLVGTGAGLAYKRLAAVAVGVLTDQFEGEASRSLGADIFNITPADVPTEVYTPSGITDFVRGTEVEIGKYVDPRTYVSIQSRLTNPFGGQKSPLGVRLVRRTGAGFQYQASYEPRYQVQTPTLAPSQDVSTFGVFGAFIIREWRF